MAATPVFLNDHNTTAPDEVVPHKETRSQTTAIEVRGLNLCMVMSCYG